MIRVAFMVLLISCADSPANFEVRVTAGTLETAAIETLTADGALTLAGGKRVPAGAWYGLRRLPGVLPAWPGDPNAEFGNGDRIVGTVSMADGDALRLAIGPAGPNEQVLRFPLSSLRAIWLAHKGEDDDPDWLAEPRRRDMIQSRNGDLVAGALGSIDPVRNLVRYQVDGKERQIPLTKVAAIGFNTDLARARRPKGPLYRLTLADGSRVSAAAVTFDGSAWTAQTLFKDRLRIAPDQIVSVDIEQGRVAFLADFPLQKYQYESTGGEHHSWARDRCVSGRPIRLKTRHGDSTFDRGIGLHSECTLSYELAGKYARFETLAGLDARSGVRGDAVLAVFVDGKPRELPGGGRLTFEGGPVRIDLDVTGGKELTIRVRKGNGGTVQDHVNLAEARLIP